MSPRLDPMRVSSPVLIFWLVDKDKYSSSCLAMTNANIRILPSRVTPEGFSVFESMLADATLTGEPLGYRGDAFKVGGRLMPFLHLYIVCAMHG